MSKRPPKQPPSQFNLPILPLPSQKDFKPFLAREKSLIEKFHDSPQGTLTAERQHQGIRVGRLMFQEAQDKNGREFYAPLLASVALNTSVYLFASKSALSNEKATRMYRVLHLPILASKIGFRSDRDWLDAQIDMNLAEATDFAENLYEATAERSKHVPNLTKLLARKSGDVALKLACVQMVDAGISDDMSAYDIQSEAKKHAISLLETSRNYHEVTGAHPTFASLAILHSPTFNYLQSVKAPRSVFDAADDAVQRLPIAA